MAGSVIISGARTPIGKLSGSLAGFSGADLGAIAINYGYYRGQTDIMLVMVVILVLIVQLIQMLGDRISRKADKRIR